MDNLNWVDYIILAIFFFSILAGFGRGFVREVVSLATLIVAFIVATMFATPVAEAFTSAPAVQNAVSQTSNAIGLSTAQPVSYVAIGISFSLLFAGTIIIGSLVGYFLNIAFQTGVLGIGNRLLGAGFGFVRGFIINLVLIFLIQLTPFMSEAWWQQSQLVKAYQPSVAALATIVAPGIASLKERFSSTLDNVNASFQGVTDAFLKGSR